MADSVKKGVLWTGIEKVLVGGIGFVQGIILARLLKPDDFGLAAMLAVFTGIGGLLSESGLGTALVVKVKTLKSECEKTAFRWNLLASLVVYAVLAAISPLVAKWYGIDILAPLMCVLAANVVINALGVVAVARITRAQAFGYVSFANTIPVVVASVTAMTMAYFGCGVWSIAGFGLVQSSLRTTMAWTFAKAVRGLWAEACQEEACSLRELLGFGWRLVVSGFIHTCYYNLYGIVIGKVWSAATVGLYARADRWSHLPGEVANESIGRVMLPRLAQGVCDVRKAVTANVLLLWPLLAMLFVFAEPVVRIVLGEKWLPCVGYIRILLVGQLFTPATNIALNVLKGEGRADLVLKSDLVKKPLGIVALTIGCFGGVAGICMAKVASDIVECAVDVYLAFRVRRHDEPVDLVYCWCNGARFRQMERSRFSENGELYYSLKSVEKYAKWIRMIYVLVNDGTEIPAWLSANSKVVIVKHSEIIPVEVLPLDNAVSIEFWMYRLPGLSERFIYGNDDMFFGRKVRPCDFFDAKGRMICRYKPGVSLRAIAGDGGTYNAQLLNCRNLLDSDNDFLPHHNFDGYLKSVIADFWKHYPDAAKASGSFKTRSRNQLSRDVFSLYAIKTGRGVYGSVKKWRLFWVSLYAELCDKAAIRRIRMLRPKMFCLNDSEKCLDEDRREIRRILKEIFGE